MVINEMPHLHCSFCNKSQKEVRKRIAGPTVMICDECIEICNEVIDESDWVSSDTSEKRSDYLARETKRAAERLVVLAQRARQKTSTLD